MIIEPDFLPIIPHANCISMIDIDTMHFAPGIRGRLQLRIITTHLRHFIPEIGQEDGLDVFLNQFLAMIGHEIKTSRIFLFGVRDADGRQTFTSRFRFGALMGLLKDADDTSIRNRMIIELHRISEGMNEILSDKRL